MITPSEFKFLQLGCRIASKACFAGLEPPPEIVQLCKKELSAMNLTDDSLFLNLNSVIGSGFSPRLEREDSPESTGSHRSEAEDSPENTFSRRELSVNFLNGTQFRTGFQDTAEEVKKQNLREKLDLFLRQNPVSGAEIQISIWMANMVVSQWFQNKRYDESRSENADGTIIYDFTRIDDEMTYQERGWAYIWIYIVSQMSIVLTRGVTLTVRRPKFMNILFLVISFYLESQMSEDKINEKVLALQPINLLYKAIETANAWRAISMILLAIISFLDFSKVNTRVDVNNVLKFVDNKTLAVFTEIYSYVGRTLADEGYRYSFGYPDRSKPSGERNDNLAIKNIPVDVDGYSF